MSEEAKAEWDWLTRGFEGITAMLERAVRKNPSMPDDRSRKVLDSCAKRLLACSITLSERGR